MYGYLRVKVNLIQWKIQFVYVNDRKKTLKMGESPCSKHPKVIKLAGCEIQLDKMDTDFSIRDHRGLVLYVFRAQSPEVCGMWFAHIKMLKQNLDPNQLLAMNKRVRWNLRVNPFSHKIQVKAVELLKEEAAARAGEEAVQLAAFETLADELRDALYFSKRTTAKIALMEMGFDPQIAAGVLVKTNGDITDAMDILTTRPPEQLEYFKQLESAVGYLLRQGYRGDEAEAALNVTNGNGPEAERILQTNRDRPLTDLLASGSLITTTATANGGDGDGAPQYTDPAAGIHNALDERFPGLASPEPRTPKVDAVAADAAAAAISQSLSASPRGGVLKRASLVPAADGGDDVAVSAVIAFSAHGVDGEAGSEEGGSLVVHAHSLPTAEAGEDDGDAPPVQPPTLPVAVPQPTPDDGASSAVSDVGRRVLEREFLRRQSSTGDGEARLSVDIDDAEFEPPRPSPPLSPSRAALQLRDPDSASGEGDAQGDAGERGRLPDGADNDTDLAGALDLDISIEEDDIVRLGEPTTAAAAPEAAPAPTAAALAADFNALFGPPAGVPATAEGNAVHEEKEEETAGTAPLPATTSSEMDAFFAEPEARSEAGVGNAAPAAAADALDELFGAAPVAQEAAAEELCSEEPTPTQNAAPVGAAGDDEAVTEDAAGVADGDDEGESTAVAEVAASAKDDHITEQAAESEPAAADMAVLDAKDETASADAQPGPADDEDVAAAAEEEEMEEDTGANGNEPSADALPAAGECAAAREVAAEVVEAAVVAATAAAAKGGDIDAAGGEAAAEEASCDAASADVLEDAPAAAVAAADAFDAMFDAAPPAVHA